MVCFQDWKIIPIDENKFYDSKQIKIPFCYTYLY